MDTVRIGQAHAIPKGFHVSNSCQPRCQPGTTCVVYRGTDGNAHLTCKSIDPHKVVLDGTFIVPSLNLQNASKNLNLFSPDTTVVNVQSLIKPLLDISADTVTTKDTSNTNSLGLLDRMKTFSGSIKDNMQNELVSIDGRPQLFNPDSFAKNVDSFPPFQNLSSTLNRNTHERRRAKFGGLTLVRNADGGVVFRRIVDIRNKPPADQDIKVEVIPLQNTNQNVEDTSTMPRPSNTLFGTSRPIQDSIPPQNLQEKGPIDNSSASCKPCDPDKKCPGNQYCFYSSACAQQICQPL